MFYEVKVFLFLINLHDMTTNGRWNHVFLTSTLGESRQFHAPSLSAGMTASTEEPHDTSRTMENRKIPRIYIYIYVYIYNFTF